MPSPAQTANRADAPPACVRDALLLARQQGLAPLDAQMLLLHALGRSPHDRAWLLAHDDAALTPGCGAAFLGSVTRRMRGEPLAYITGRQEFFGLDLHVDARVLVPRADTETLVEWALELLAPLRHPRVLDLGTGSGAIALALQKHCPAAEVWAVDASSDALAVASGNARSLGMGQVHFAHGRWYDPLPAELRFDLIVSNPPYIRDGDEHLESLAFEPQQALTSGSDGLDDIRAIVAHAGAHLNPGAWLLLEHGYDQAASVRALLASEPWAGAQSRNDLAGIARCTGARWQSAG